MTYSKTDSIVTGTAYCSFCSHVHHLTALYEDGTLGGYCEECAKYNYHHRNSDKVLGYEIETSTEDTTPKPQFDIHDSANRLHSNTQSEIYLDPPNLGAEVNMTFGNEYDEIVEETEDIINKPNHYHQGGIDVIGFAKKQFSREEQRGFFRINLLKYVVRFDKKGTPIADLDKAQVYLNELKALETENHEN